MKMLFLSQGKHISDHPGWHNALQKLQKENYIEHFLNIPYLDFGDKYGWKKFFDYILKLIINENYQVIYFHYFHKFGLPSTKDFIERLRKTNSSIIVLTSCGDPFSDNWMRPDYPKCFKEISSLADITFSTQMGKAADKMISWGTNYVVYSPNSLCQVRFKAGFIDPLKHKFDFDVVFLGSRNSKSYFNPISKYYFATRERKKIINILSKRFGKRFGLFGNGWEGNLSNQGYVNFDDQQKVFRRGRIIVGGNPYSKSNYYSSNRTFFSVASGVPVIELSVPRLNKIFKNQEHVYFVKNADNILKKVDELLSQDPIDLYKKSKRAAVYVEKNHTQYHRMKFKIDVVKNYLKNNRRIIDLKLPYFLSGVDVNKEYDFAIYKSKK